MELSPYITELQDSLRAAASLGDETTQRAAGALGAALEPAARLALIHALSDLAAEITRQLADGAGDPVTVDVTLDGRNVRVTAGRRSGPPPSDPVADEPPADRTFSDASGDLTRTTVRMFNELKGRAEKAAADQGVSLNSFISRAVADSMRTDKAKKWKDWEGKPGKHGGDSPTTISGYVQG